MNRSPQTQPRFSAQEDHLNGFPAFAPVVSNAFETFRDMPASEEVPKGTCLIEQGSQPGSVFLLRDGLVKLIHISDDGRESIVGLRAPGWYAGAVSTLVRRPSPYTVKCVTEVAISRIPASEFSQWLSLSARRSNHLTQTLCNELLSQASLSQLSNQSAEQRVNRFVQESRTPDAVVKTLDPQPLLRRFELAQLLSITPEHLSRMFPRGSDTPLKDI